MKKGPSLKSEFKVANFGFGHSEPSLFVTSTWGGPPWAYAVWRWVAFCYALSWLIISGITEGSPQWFIFLTNLGYLVLVINLSLGAIVVLLPQKQIMTVRVGEIPPEKLTLPWYLKVYWVFYDAATNLAIAVTILYWVLVYEGRSDLTAISINTHAMNSFIVLVDLAVTAIPIRLLHFYIGVSIGMAYAIFSAIWQVALDNGRIYDAVDWVLKPQSTGILLAVLGFLGVPFLWVVMYVVYRLRLWVKSKCGSNGEDREHEGSRDNPAFEMNNP